MVDPRISVIFDRLQSVKRIVAVSSGKGGVGKSLVASTLALILTKKGYNVGLFDLDFTSPSTHVILGISDVQPTEDKGIIPPAVHGLKYMSLIYFTGKEAAPLRGADVSNALIELLSITRWGELDFLVIDMPPGIGDVTLDLVRLIKRIEFLIVTTPSQLAFETVRKLVKLLKELRVPVIGIIENMKVSKSNYIREQAEKLELDFLAEIPYDANVEDAIGDMDRMLSTLIAERISGIVSNNL